MRKSIARIREIGRKRILSTFLVRGIRKLIIKRKIRIKFKSAQIVRTGGMRKSGMSRSISRKFN